MRKVGGEGYGPMHNFSGAYNLVSRSSEVRNSLVQSDGTLLMPTSFGSVLERHQIISQVS